MFRLPPLLLREKYWTGIEKEIQRIFDEVIYKPLFALLKEKPEELSNSTSALLDAIRAGSVWYEDGVFSGKFGSKISADLRSIGARYNAASRTWSLKRNLLPSDVYFAQAAADSHYDELRRAFIRTIDDMNIESVDRYSKTQKEYDQSIEWMNNDFEKAVKAISIAPKLTAAQRAILANEWGDNLNLYIKNWVSENILSLRAKVQANAFAGRRSSALVEMMQKNYGVSKRKAEFLARQETSLLVSNLSKQRYQDVGSKRYIWKGTMDKRERVDHRDLQNKVFSWDSPPVTDRRTGARNNPGCDYNCRCIAIPIID